MDVAVNLVESYLRLTGYVTMSEFEIQARNADGGFDTLTDIDILAVRSPGDVVLGDQHSDAQGRLLVVEDPALLLVYDCMDILIGEVKQGTAEFNPALKDHRVLHSVLRRFEWLYADGLGDAVAALQRDGVHIAEARGGGRIRSRLVAFGRTPQNTVNTIGIGHIVETLLAIFHQHEAAFRPIQFKEPAVAFLRLLDKVGFTLTR